MTDEAQQGVSMQEQEQMVIQRCAQALFEKMPWIETVDGHFDGPVLRLQVAHSYPVDVRRDIRRVVRRTVNRIYAQMQIELHVIQVSAGYAEAIRGAEEIALAGRDCPDRYNDFWN